MGTWDQPNARTAARDLTRRVNVGGVAIGTPAVVAAAIPQFEPYVPAAAGQCAFAVIVCAILVPIIARKFTGKTEG